MKKSIIVLIALFIFGLMPVASDCAATALSEYKISRSGQTVTAQAVDWSNGNALTLNTGAFLRFENLDGTNAMTVTIAVQKTSNDGYTNNAVIPFATSAVKYLGPFSTRWWADSAGKLQLSYSAGTQPISPTVEVMRLPFGESEASTK